MLKYIFLAILILSSGIIIWLNRKRNAWDILFFNSPVVIVALFMIGILANNSDVWQTVVWSIAIVATGGSFAWALIDNLKRKLKENSDRDGFI